jgi:hypothetical protein
MGAARGDTLLHGVVAGAVRLHLRAATRDGDAAADPGVDADTDALVELLVRAMQSDPGRRTLADQRTWFAVLRRIDSALLAYAPAAAVRVAECLVAALRAPELCALREATLTFLCGVAHRFRFVSAPPAGGGVQLGQAALLVQRFEHAMVHLDRVAEGARERGDEEECDAACYVIVRVRNGQHTPLFVYADRSPSAGERDARPAPRQSGSEQNSTRWLR